MRFLRSRSRPPRSVPPQPVANAELHKNAERPSDEEEPGAPAELGCLADGVLAYHLFLGRAPENDEVALAYVGTRLKAAAERFFDSEEFRTRVLLPVIDAGAPSEWQGQLPLTTLDAPLAHALPIDVAAAAAARNWAEDLGVLLAAPIPRQVLQRLHGEAAEALLHRADAALVALLARVASTAEALERVRTVSRGVTVSAVSDLVAQDGRLRATSSDPWILATADPLLASRPLLRCLTLSFAREDERRTGRVKIYVDLGHGFDEASVLAVPTADDHALFLLAPTGSLARIRIDPVEEESCFTLEALTLEPVRDGEALEALLKTRLTDKAAAFYRSRAVMRLAGRTEQAEDNLEAAFATSRLMTALLHAGSSGGDYREWIACYEQPFAADYARMADMMKAFPRKPTFSFVVPIYNTPVDLLLRCLRSMLDQNYPHFTVCIADDNSPDPRGAEMVQAITAQDPRVRLVRRCTNGHISAATNSAIAVADGDFIVLVDHDDVIPDYCLFVLAEAINRRPDARILFSDEDKLDEAGTRCLPYFKSKLNEFLLFGHNMISHLGVYETELVRRVGGFRKGYEGSQDYDLALRCLHEAGPQAVVHIPHVLYHWQMISGSTAVAIGEKSYAASAATRAVDDYLARAHLPLAAQPGDIPGLNRVEATAVPDTLVSILIPTRDGLDLLRPCIESVRRTATGRYEIVVIDNNSVDPATIAYFDELQRDEVVRVVAYPEPFNFSAINNFGVGHSTGDIICFLNNDTEAVSEQWLDRARALLSIPAVGAVGARLLYPDGTVQHMGITLGMGAHGVAGTPHGGLPDASPGYFGKAHLLAEFSAVTAACLFVGRGDYEAVGGFDPAFAVAYNDIDLCLKLRAKALKILCDPDITLIHKESRTRGYDVDDERMTRLQREAALFIERWSETLRNDPYHSPNHTLLASDFELAWPPRVPMPWLCTAGEQ